MKIYEYFLVILFVFVVFMFILKITFTQEYAENNLNQAFEKERNCILENVKMMQMSDNKYSRIFGDQFRELISSMELDITSSEFYGKGWIVHYTLTSKGITQNYKSKLSFFRTIDFGDEIDDTSDFDCISDCNENVPNYDRKICYSACDEFDDLWSNKKCDVSFLW